MQAGADCVVADASVVISLSASLGFEGILRELPCRFMVPDAVHEELQVGRKKGHTAAADLEIQLSAGRAEIVHPAETLTGESVRLVSSGEKRQLDLGEAETIACALELNAVALLDENRARRVCERHFPGLAVAQHG